MAYRESPNFRDVKSAHVGQLMVARVMRLLTQQRTLTVKTAKSAVKPPETADPSGLAVHRVAAEPTPSARQSPEGASARGAPADAVTGQAKSEPDGYL
jgi:hypothetical protein